MEEAMDPVLSQIGEDEDPRELHDEGLSRDPSPHLRVGRPLEEDHCGLECEQRRHLDEEGADEEIDDVGAPSVAEDGLRAVGEETLERDEERRVGDEVQEEQSRPRNGPVRSSPSRGRAFRRAAWRRG
jgi:hypothetical protein